MEAFADFRQGLEAASNEALGEIRRQWTQYSSEQGAIEAFKGFLAAVDWSEPWLIVLLVVEAALLTSLIVFRRHSAFQGAVSLLAGAVVYNAERLNTWLAQHWHSFAGQPYFDKHGIFISTVLSAPMLLAMFIALVNTLVSTSQLLVQMKRKELRHKARQHAKQEQSQHKKSA